MYYPALLFCGYVFLFIRFKLLPLGRMKKALSDKYAFNSLMVLLGSSAGVGNIIGVGIAIFFAGPGVLFWMCVCAIIAATTNFLEVYYSQRNKEGIDCGSLNYFPKAFGKKGKFISIIYASLMLLISVLIGNMCQVGSITATFSKINPLIITIIVSVLFIVCTIKYRGILSLMGGLMPFICLLYLLFCFMTLAINYMYVGDALVLVFHSAFQPQAVLGIPLFFVFNQGLVFSLFSNEAGNGSAALAFADNDSKATPYKSGLLSSYGPILDTVIICFISGITILSSPQYNQLRYLKTNPNTEIYILEVFRTSLGNVGYFVTLVCVVLFAFATLVSWYYYGCKSSKYLRIPVGVYRVIYIACIILSAFYAITFLMDITNYVNLALLSINIVAILIVSFKEKATVKD